MPVSSDRPTRRDAVRNRRRLTDAAVEAFRDEGLDISVDEIARRAGVGVATLYRHFPAKSDLVLAVTEATLDELEAAVVAALAEGDPLGATRRFLDATLDLQRRNRGFLQALAEHELADEVRACLVRRTMAILEPVVAAGHRTRTVRPELGAADLLVVVRMLSAASADASNRAVDVLARGLAA